MLASRSCSPLIGVKPLATVFDCFRHGLAFLATKDAGKIEQLPARSALSFRFCQREIWDTEIWGKWGKSGDTIRVLEKNQYCVPRLQVF